MQPPLLGVGRRMVEQLNSGGGMQYGGGSPMMNGTTSSDLRAKSQRPWICTNLSS